MTLPPFWQLDGFGERLDIWAETQEPDDELINRVVDWTYTRFETPYQGVRREPDFPNLWFAVVPGTVRGSTVVTCTYRIFEGQRLVSCDGYATLRLPV